MNSCKRCGLQLQNLPLMVHRLGDDAADPFRRFDKVRIVKVSVTCRGPVPPVPE